MSSSPSQFLNIDGKLLFLTFGMRGVASPLKQYSGSFMPDIISFAMQPLHNAYADEYQWFYYMLNTIPTMQLRWVQGGKSIAVQKVMAHVIMALLIPHRKYFDCGIRMYVACCCLLRSVLLHDRAQATISIIFQLLTSVLIWWFVSFLLSKHVGHSWCRCNPSVWLSKAELSKNKSSLTARQIAGQWFHNVTWDSQMECDELQCIVVEVQQSRQLPLVFPHNWSTHLAWQLNTKHKIQCFGKTKSH